MRHVCSKLTGNHHRLSHVAKTRSNPTFRWDGTKISYVHFKTRLTAERVAAGLAEIRSVTSVYVKSRAMIKMQVWVKKLDYRPTSVVLTKF